MHNLISIISLVFILNFCTSAATVRNDNDSTCRSSTLSSENTAHSQVYFNDEKTDKAKIQSVLNKVKDIDDVNERVIAITQEFIGIPYVGGTLNVPSEEQLYVNTKALDCLTFVETVIALALSEQPHIEDYISHLQSIRYHNGEIDGYASRLHYISEWSIDNARRGNFKEISSECGLSQKNVKTIDFMTKNRKLYPALEKDEVFKAIKKNESVLKNLEYSYIPAGMVNKAAKSCLKSGDIVAIVTNKPGLDVSHVGIINIKNGIPYLIHASSKYKKVINDTLSLQDYLKRQGSPGIRVFRL